MKNELRGRSCAVSFSPDGNRIPNLDDMIKLESTDGLGDLSLGEYVQLQRMFNDAVSQLLHRAWLYDINIDRMMKSLLERISKKSPVKYRLVNDVMTKDIK